MIPVQMRDHDRPPEGSVPEDVGEYTEPGPCIEDELGCLAVVGKRNTRRVAAGLGVFCAR